MPASQSLPLEAPWAQTAIRHTIRIQQFGSGMGLAVHEVSVHPPWERGEAGEAGEGKDMGMPGKRRGDESICKSPKVKQAGRQPLVMSDAGRG
jgi:hypothetical protein